MQSLSQNTGLTAATEDSSQDIIPTVAGGGGRASFSAEEKQFTSCSRCLLLKPAARLKPEGVAPPRCLRWAKVCEARGPGTGPSVRQAGPSRALPCGLGSHSHPSAARTRPVPAPRQPSAPSGAARPGSGARGPEAADAAARTPESARRPPGLSAPREAVSGGRCCPLLLLFLSLLPAAHTTPTLGSREARHGRCLHPFPGHTVFPTPSATRLGTPCLRRTQPPRWPPVEPPVGGGLRPATRRAEAAAGRSSDCACAARRAAFLRALAAVCRGWAPPGRGLSGSRRARAEIPGAAPGRERARK